MLPVWTTTPTNIYKTDKSENTDIDIYSNSNINSTRAKSNKEMAKKNAISKPSAVFDWVIKKK